MYITNGPPVEIMRRVTGYKGRKFQVVSCTEVELYGAYWSGGSKNKYYAVDLVTGEYRAAADLLNGPTVKLELNKAIIKHCIFQGKDLGCTMYCLPENLPERLSVEKVDDEVKAVLRATRGYKASYGGNKWFRQEQSGLTREQWLVAVERCKSLGYLDSRGAVTTEGKNVCLN